MKPLLSLICLTLIAAPVHAAPATPSAPAVESCRVRAEAAVKRTAAYRYGSVREKQALLRGQAVAAYVRVCVARQS